MPSTSLEQIVASSRDRLASYTPAAHLDAQGAERIGRDAADFVAARSLFRSRIATRIGPVYDTEQLARWQAPPNHPLTPVAVRKRAGRQLIAFQAEDRAWLFPPGSSMPSGVYSCRTLR